MLTRIKKCHPAEAGTRGDALVGGGLTIGAALVIAAIMVLGDSPTAEAIGLTMFPGVLAVGPLWISMRRRSRGFKMTLIGGLFLFLFLIGLLAGLATNG